jgi:hypothetical protein
MTASEEKELLQQQAETLLSRVRHAKDIAVPLTVDTSRLDTIAKEHFSDSFIQPTNRANLLKGFVSLAAKKGVKVDDALLVPVLGTLVDELYKNVTHPDNFKDQTFLISDTVRQGVLDVGLSRAFKDHNLSTATPTTPEVHHAADVSDGAVDAALPHPVIGKAVLGLHRASESPAKVSTASRTHTTTKTSSRNDILKQLTFLDGVLELYPIATLKLLVDPQIGKKEDSSVQFLADLHELSENLGDVKWGDKAQKKGVECHLDEATHDRLHAALTNVETHFNNPEWMYQPGKYTDGTPEAQRVDELRTSLDTIFTKIAYQRSPVGNELGR